jgi:hypothetical protein
VPTRPSEPFAEVDDLSRYFHRYKWGGPQDETASGKGSTLHYTAGLRDWLPGLLRRLGVHRFLDAPCGDFNWMRTVDLDGISYIGMDIVADLTGHLQQTYGSERRRFLTGDITRDPLPEADLMMCRDCLFHLPYAYDWQALENFARSGIPYLLTTSHLGRNRDIDQPGQWRQLNLMAPPFTFPPPLEQVDDWVDGHPRRIMGLWSREQVSEALAAREAPQRTHVPAAAPEPPSPSSLKRRRRPRA